MFHSSRLARGSGRKDEARSLQELLVYLRRHGVTVRSVEDDAFTTNPMLWGVASEMAAKYADDLSAHTRRGLRARKERGDPVGPIPDGHRPTLVSTDAKGRPVMKRLPDPDRVPIVERQFDLADRHLEPGAIARNMNAAGLRNRRGKPFTARRVRETLRNTAYIGEKGYEPIIDPDLFERVQAFLDSRAQTRSGGRPGQPYLLKGIARCRCGAPMYIKRYARGRAYKCSAAIDARGTCSRPPIPAEPLEQAVLDHLHLFLGDVREWIAG